MKNLLSETAPGTGEAPQNKRREKHIVIRDESAISLKFNVMPGRDVTETMFIEKYVIGENIISGYFHRTYSSQMINSPSHLIFLTALTHMQKLTYVYLCEKFGFDYDPNGIEKLKVWPMSTNCSMPKLLTEEEGLIQTLEFHSVIRRSEKVYWVKVTSRVGDALKIDAVAKVLLLEEPLK